MPHVTTRDGVKLYLKDWGAGPPVVLIHGWPLDADMWEAQAPVLAARGHRVIAYDRRGFGRSDQPWTGYDYDTLADDLAAVIDGLELEGVTLVGFSMGGGEVARYLSRHGAGKVAKAVLVGSVTPFLLKTADNPDGADKSLFDGMVEQLKKDRPHFLAGFGQPFYGTGLLKHPVSDEMVRWSQSVAMLASPQATTACVRAFSETDFRPDMAAFTVPTLIVHGTGDQTVPIDISGRVTARMIPHSQLIEYDGAPHGLFATEADRLTSDLLIFLRS